MIRNLRKNKKGFTLVEIIVVLVIMGILLAIAVPSVLGYVNKAKEQQYLAEAHNGFMGAQTIVLRENVTKPTPLSKLDADAINAELGENIVKSASCSLAIKDGRYAVTKCDIELTSYEGHTITFKSNSSSEIKTGEVTNTNVTYPTATAPTE